MTETKNINTLPDAERNRIRTEMIGAASPYVEAAQAAKKAVEDYTRDMSKKYHGAILSEKLSDLEHDRRHKILRNLPKGETHDSYRKKLLETKPGEFDPISKLTPDEGKQLNALTDAARDTRQKIKDAVDGALKKNGLEYDLNELRQRLKPGEPIPEAEAMARYNNDQFRKAVTENLISPLVSKESGTGPAPTPGKQPAQKIGK